MVGEIIAHYRIVAEIGRGGMGVVYRAEDTRLHCHRALKFLPANVTPDSPEHIRLVNEARALAALEHPNICPVQEIGEHEGQTYIVMSCLEGRTLKDRLDEGPIPVAEALEITRQISSALAAAHSQGIIHRDIKPDNVMLTEPRAETKGGLRAILMDFGIAKNREATLNTRTGTIMGTMAYMSPEQTKGEPVDASTDVWAVGVLLYEMLAGQRPFQGDIEPAVLYAIVNSEPEPLTSKVQDVPEAVERVIGKALAKETKDRYINATELLTDLDKAVEGESVKGRPLAKKRTRSLWGSTAAVLGILLVVLFVWPGFLNTPDAISVLAVMPLEDRNDNPDQAYFAEGIADDLASGLNKISALTIVSRNSASQARELYSTNREIRSALGVDALVEGSIQRVGDRIKVSVQLVATDDDRLLWSESYTRDMKDILNLQSEIALAISSALEAELTPGEQDKLAEDRPIDPVAYEEYLLGVHFNSLATPESTLKAQKHFERALALEPDWALPHAWLATNYILLQQMAGLPPSSVFEEIKSHAQSAMRLDPGLAVAHATLGTAAMVLDWDLAAAGAHYAKAREMDPNLDMMDYAQYLDIMGRRQEALVQAKHAARVDPLNSFTQANLASRYNHAGQTEKALAEIDRLHERDPDNWVSLWIQGIIFIEQGNPSEAVDILHRAVVESGDAPSVKPVYAYSLVLAGRQEEANAILEELEKQDREGYLQQFYLGQIYAAFGRNDEAFAAYERSIEERDWLMFWVSPKFTPCTRELAKDPRWPALLAKTGVPVD